MKPEPLNTALVEEHERAQRLASLDHLASLMRTRSTSDHTLHTLLTGFNEYLKSASIPPLPSSSSSNTPSSDLVAHNSALPLSQVTAQPLTWLWPERIPRGKLTLLDGAPGSGTSLLALTLAACLSSACPLPATPDPSTIPTPANVLLIAPHDDAADTIAPRFQAAGGDPNHLFLLSTVETVATRPTISLAERPFSLADDLALLEATIQRLSVALVIIDPLHSVLGSARSRSSSPRPSLRTLLFSLAQLAQRTGCAFLLIRQLSTRPSDPRHPRLSGSPDLVSAARSSLLLVTDPNDEETHLLVPTKHPLCQKAATLAYQVIAHETDVPTIHWLTDWQPSPSVHPASAPPLSAQHQAIRDYLLQSLTAASPSEIAAHTGYDYACVRKMLQRLCQQEELVSPARGLYTLPGHPCLLHFDTNPETIPPHNDVPSVANVPCDEKSLSPLPFVATAINDLIHVANVPGEANIYPITLETNQKCSTLSGGQVCDPRGRQVPPFPAPPSDPSENRFPSAIILPRNDSPW